jgi:membrane-bound serine protease (ClpP class)
MQSIRWGLWLVLVGLLIAPSVAQDGADVPQAVPPTSPTTPATQPAATQPTTATPISSQSQGLAAIATGHDVAIIPVSGMIYGFTLESMERRIDRARDNGATVFVIELDTNGGELGAALEIAKYLKSLPEPTVAWINNKAYSAGILIASAADAIVMTSSSSIGDAAPIVPGQELSPTERAKALSPLLAEFRDNALQNGYDPALLHAMAELGVEVYEVRHDTTGEVRFVNQADVAFMVDGETMNQVMTRFGYGGGAGSGAATQPTGAGVSLDPSLQPAERGQWTLVRQVHNGRSLLTVDQTTAQTLGLSAGIVDSEADIRQTLGPASLTRIEQTWSEQIAGFLTSPIVRGVLVMLVLVGGYFELQAPGFGLGGGIALAALAALIAAPFVVGLAEVWHVVVFIIGFAMLVLELLFTPTFGIMGICGLLMMLVGLVLAVVPTVGSGPMPMPAPGTMDRMLQSAVWLVLGLLGSVGGFVLLTMYFGKIPVLNKLVLADDAPAGGAFAADGTPAGPYHPLQGDESVGSGKVQVGDGGRVLGGGLRPGGRVELDSGLIVDVVSTGGWIERNAQVRVVEALGNRIVVDEAEA